MHIAWERSGNPEGIPVVIVIHGGPGGGSQPSYRRYFNPGKIRHHSVRSKGLWAIDSVCRLEDNNTHASVSDLENLREHFGIDSWHVFGGSWGLDSVVDLCSESSNKGIEFDFERIFMCRKSELHWFYQDGASHVFSDAFDSYRDHIPIEEQDDLIKAYYSRLTSEDVEIRRAAAREWTRWEMATSRLFPDRISRQGRRP